MFKIKKVFKEVDFLTSIQGVLLLLISLCLIVSLIVSVIAGFKTRYITGTIVSFPVEDGNICVCVKPDGLDIANILLSNEDSIWRLKFNSRDVIQKLKIGDKYTFKCNGIRIPIMSKSINILEVIFLK